MGQPFQPCLSETSWIICGRRTPSQYPSSDPMSMPKGPARNASSSSAVRGQTSARCRARWGWGSASKNRPGFWHMQREYPKSAGRREKISRRARCRRQIFPRIVAAYAPIAASSMPGEKTRGCVLPQPNSGAIRWSEKSARPPEFDESNCAKASKTVGREMIASSAAGSLDEVPLARTHANARPGRARSRPALFERGRESRAYAIAAAVWRFPSGSSKQLGRLFAQEVPRRVRETHPTLSKVVPPQSAIAPDNNRPRPTWFALRPLQCPPKRPGTRTSRPCPLSER